VYQAPPKSSRRHVHAAPSRAQGILSAPRPRTTPLHVFEDAQVLTTRQKFSKSQELFASSPVKHNSGSLNFPVGAAENQYLSHPRSTEISIMPVKPAQPRWSLLNGHMKIQPSSILHAQPVVPLTSSNYHYQRMLSAESEMDSKALVKELLILRSSLIKSQANEHALREAKHKLEAETHSLRRLAQEKANSLHDSRIHEDTPGCIRCDRFSSNLILPFYFIFDFLIYLFFTCRSIYLYLSNFLSLI
jgi:hypothetical protein